MKNLERKNRTSHFTHHTSQKGITLIALIITIIVMLILVGVTINVALNGGLFEKAEEAKKQTEKAVEEEQLMVAIVSAYNEKTGVVDKTTLQTELSKQGTWQVTGEGPYGVTSPKGNDYTVTKNGKIEDGNGSKKEGNEVIIQIINKYALKEITEEEAIQQLKQELSIEDEDIKSLDDLVESYYYKAEDIMYIYIKEADEIYTMVDETGASYVKEETNKEIYNKIRGILIIREELEYVFAGTTSAEMLEKFNDGTLDEYVIGKSDIISVIGVEECGNSWIDFNYITIYEGGENETTLSGDVDNYHMSIIYENGNYSYVAVGARYLEG